MMDAVLHGPRDEQVDERIFSCANRLSSLGGWGGGEEGGIKKN